MLKEAPLHSLTLSTQIVPIFAAQNLTMKKTTLLLIASAFSFGLGAQTLQFGTAPEPGDVHKYREDTLQVAQGSAGQGQTWNFASLVMDTAVTTETYISPVGTPGAASFPSATVAQFEDSTYTYIRVTPSKAEVLGLFSNASGPVSGQAQVFSNPATLMQFPLSINQSFLDTGSVTVSLGPGITFTITINQNATVDGTGTLVLPSGTFSNVLRIKNTITNTTSSLFGNSTSVEESYSWYDSATKFPLFSVSTTTDNSATPPVTHNVVMRVNSIGSGLEKNAPLVSTHIFPNPAQVNGALSVRTDGRGLSRVLVYDVLGKLVFEDQQAQTNGRVYSIGTQGWMPGVYLVQVVQDGKTSSGKVILE